MVCPHSQMALRSAQLPFRVLCILHNAWHVVAFALVVSTLTKGLCDYAGTYLINYAGFGLITDLRNHLYEATLRRSLKLLSQTPHRNHPLNPH